MFMLILLPSVRVKALRLLCALGVLGGFHQVSFGADTSQRVATVDDVRDINSRIASVFANLDDFPEAPVSSVKLEKKLYWSGPAANAILLAPVVVRFRGLINSYCRLVTVKAESKEMTLVQLPAQANFEDCNGVDQIRYLDVNGDGRLDVVETVKVKSNVQDGVVSTALVYLSSPQQPGGYCYSATASRQLAPADLKSDSAVLKALGKHGQPLLCGSQP